MSLKETCIFNDHGTPKDLLAALIFDSYLLVILNHGRFIILAAVNPKKQSRI
jgi:hypothetical protein